MNKLFCILGKSASGKNVIIDSLLNKIKENNISIELLPSCTTRPMRSGETQGVEYNFTTNDDFYKHYKNNDVLEYATYNTKFGVWHYYTLLSDLKLDMMPQLKIINPLGLSQVTCSIPKENLVVIYIDCDDVIRLNRSINRGDNMIEVKDRVLRDNEDFKYLHYDYKILNNGNCSIDKLSDDILEILNKELK